MMAKKTESIYERMLLVVGEIPRGRVATYGQIAWIAGAASPRMAGDVLAGLPTDTDVPWQRVVNSRGGISPRADPLATDRQRRVAYVGEVNQLQAGRPHRSGAVWLGRARTCVAGSTGLYATSVALPRIELRQLRA